MSADGWSPIAMHMLRNWKDIVVAARLSLCLALLSSLRSWQMFTLKTELRPVAGNHQVVYRHPECFYFCPLLWWENGWVWWNISSPPLRPVQLVGRTWQTRESVWNSYCRSLSVWPFFTSLSRTSLCTPLPSKHMYTKCVFFCGGSLRTS